MWIGGWLPVYCPWASMVFFEVMVPWVYQHAVAILVALALLVGAVIWLSFRTWASADV